jgi:hypothetical protein
MLIICLFLVLGWRLLKSTLRYRASDYGIHCPALCVIVQPSVNLNITTKLLFAKGRPELGLGNRRAVQILCRFRLGYTTLNDDLGRRNIVPSRLCPCGLANESYIHYFLTVPSTMNLGGNCTTHWPHFLMSQQSVEQQCLELFYLSIILYGKGMALNHHVSSNYTHV